MNFGRFDYIHTSESRVRMPFLTVAKFVFHFLGLYRELNLTNARRDSDPGIQYRVGMPPPLSVASVKSYTVLFVAQRWVFFFAMLTSDTRAMRYFRTLYVAI